MSRPVFQSPLRAPRKWGRMYSTPWLLVKALLLGALWLLSSCAVRPPTAGPVGYAGDVLATSDFDVLTQHNNRERTGANLVETRLQPGNVGSEQFQRLFHWDVDGQIYGQPLYLSHVDLQGQTVNLVIVATMSNSVYAFEAPSADSTARPSKEPLWHVDRHTLGGAAAVLFLSVELGHPGLQHLA